jgi:hypothetical protein
VSATSTGILKAVDTVAEQLGQSAPRFARDSLAALSSDDNLAFALYAATSLEHLLKCYLARKHPALIVEASSFDSLLLACGFVTAAKAKRDEVKTVSATESLKRATQFLPLLSAHRKSLEQLFALRNGAAHLGDSDSVSAFVLPFLKVSEQLREALELDRNEYWGEYVSLADKTLHERVAAVELKVGAAIAAAKTTFEKRFEDIDAPDRGTMIAALEPSTFWGDEEQPATCPACESTALATGDVEVEWQYEQVGDDDFEATLDATFVPTSIRCKICGLNLADYDELVAAGITAWTIDVDPGRYEEERAHEPDEDWYRNR